MKTQIQSERPIDRPRGIRAFTLIELLVVTGIIGILAGMLAVAVAKSKAKTHGILCLNNNRQLHLAWTLYAEDNNDRLVFNLGGDASRKTIAPKSDANWVNNLMTWELDADNTNTVLVSHAALGAYSQRATGIYRCPADRVLSEIQRRAGWTARLRSLSMNAMVGDAGELTKWGVNINNPSYRQFLRMSDFKNPTQIFVFLDEHPDSINDGYFLNKPEDAEWVDLPASYHNGAGSFSFADGHSEVHRWLSASTKRPAKPDGAPLPFAVPSQERTDFDWLIERTSVER